MRMRIEGFELHVLEENDGARVRVFMADGVEIIDTAALSIDGLERLARVIEAAALNARDVAEHYWNRQHEKRRMNAGNSPS